MAPHTACARGFRHRIPGRALLFCCAAACTFDATAQEPGAGAWSIVPYTTYTSSGAAIGRHREYPCAAFVRCDPDRGGEVGDSGSGALLRAIGVQLGALRDAAAPELDSLYGAAVQYQLSPQWSLSADWAQFRLKAGEERSDVVYSVGTKYRF